MNHTFELNILQDQLTAGHWQKLYQAILSYGGTLSKFEIIFKCEDNVVRFFVRSAQDLSSLSNNIEGFVLRPVNSTALEVPHATQKEHLVQFVTGGNILDLREKYAVKKTKSLELAVFKIRAVSAQKSIVKSELYFKLPGDRWSKAQKTMLFFPVQLFAIDFTNNTRYLKKGVPKYLDIEKSLHMLVSNETDALFEVDTFPYFSHNNYLNLGGYEFDKHSFIIGASGSGKSKFISLFVDRLQRTQLKNNYRVVVIDPHAALAEDFQHLPSHKVINFAKDEGTELFAGAAADISAATELTATLFKSLLDDQFNPRLDRLLRYTLFVLFTAQTMSLDNLKRFLTDIELRNQVLDHVGNFVPANIIKFFGTDFNEIRTKHYNEAILPIVSLVDEMQLQPSLVQEGDVSLAKTIQDNFLTLFSLNKVSMGDKVVKTVAGLLIQQLFLLAQARAFSQKVILIIDEVSVVQNPALASILAEARKFNLTVILTQQYFGQIDKELRDSIFANVFNYYAFKVSEEDARALEGNLNMELPKEIIEENHAKGVKEIDVRVKMMTELNPRDCLVRVASGGQISPAIKARTMDAPLTTSASTSHVKKTETKALPQKFVEQDAGTIPPLNLSAPNHPETAPTSPEKEPAVNFELDPLERPGQQPELERYIEKKVPRSDRAIKLGHIVMKSEDDSNKRGFSLSELLAQHSSSRRKVNKRKAKS